LDSKNHDELIKYVMKKETSNEDTILHVAMKQNNIEIIEFLLPFFDLKLDFEKWIEFLEINDIENTKAIDIVTEDEESNMKIKNLLNEKLDIAKLIKIVNDEKKNKNNTFLEILRNSGAKHIILSFLIHKYDIKVDIFPTANEMKKAQKTDISKIEDIKNDE